MKQHYLHSSFREKLIEHLLVSELLKLSWQRGDCSLEIAKPEVDNKGYDLIAENDGVVRHIQLKAAHHGSSTSEQKVHLALAGKPSGCVLWVYFDERTLELGPFLLFAGRAGEPLPSLSGFRVGKHTKANAEGRKTERPFIRVIPKGRFRRIDTIDALFSALFYDSDVHDADGSEESTPR